MTNTLDYLTGAATTKKKKFYCLETISKLFGILAADVEATFGSSLNRLVVGQLTEGSADGADGCGQDGGRARVDHSLVVLLDGIVGAGLGGFIDRIHL
jgi:hypothetical protein